MVAAFSIAREKWPLCHITYNSSGSAGEVIAAFSIARESCPVDQ